MHHPCPLIRVVAIAVATVALLGCGDDGAAPATSTTTAAPTSTPSTSPLTTSSSTTTTTTTETPEPTCDDTAVLAVVDDALAQARLAPGGGWSTELGDSTYAPRTTTGDTYAARLGLDCGLVAAATTDTGERLVIAAWTGSRMGFVVQTNDSPSEPYRPDATFTVVIDATQGEFVDGDARSIWAGTFADGDTFVVGTVDHALGAIAKDWVDIDGESSDLVSLDSERHAIAALEEANMRNVDIAELPMLGSEEGYVMFTSPAGQIMVADVAPTDWFDPMQPRYFSGATAIEQVAGVDVRRTDPTPDDNLGFTIGAEWGWACADFVWILQPPFNGTADEMLATVDAIVSTDECTTVH